MARQSRFDLAGVPQHVVQHGNNRLPCFLDDGDRQRYLQCLLQSLARFDCRLHAYVLMSNRVHLLLTPASVGAVSRLMQAQMVDCGQCVQERSVGACRPPRQGKFTWPRSLADAVDRVFVCLDPGVLAGAKDSPLRCAHHHGLLKQILRGRLRII